MFGVRNLRQLVSSWSGTHSRCTCAKFPKAVHDGGNSSFACIVYFSACRASDPWVGNAPSATFCWDLFLLFFVSVRSSCIIVPVDFFLCSPRAYRMAAYRQYTYWVYGRRLGKHVRHVVPACAVHAIRDTYPESDGSYTGFRHAEEENVYWPG